ncbi:MAG: hypothetical protein ACPHN3_01800 [Spongiibacter sp.]|uniref:Alpha/beta hydrolase family protein n=1 Tax=Spongiibacter thalassae TaxID=2721624 RepID=A0ABX1GFQ2_9GAMM|nr:hypothetical protein [Spongiibacter thalassae]NKI18040.1 hypothetical protein [Spongiibacter thalassae]
MKKLSSVRRALGVLLLMVAGDALAAPCLIFVHGKQTDTNTYTSYTAARNYWVNGSDDFVRTATKNYQASYYVVGYNGTKPYWEAESAGEVANEIVNATNGGSDGGGNSCAQTYAQGGTFWIVAHSMGGVITDYILGNNDSSDPNYNYNGPYDLVASRVSMAITTGGAHRGSEGADAVCGQSSGGCNWFAGWIQSCDDATWWLRSSNDVQVRTYASAPAKNIYLTGGYEAIFGASACLSGEDDGVVQYASIFACDGSAGASYNNSNACGNNYKQEVSGFFNLDAAHENHGDERDDSDSDTRRQIPDGIWTCSGTSCAPNTQVQSSMTTAKFISILY